MRDNVDTSKVYTEQKDFFNLNGSSIMRLAPDTAINVCIAASSARILVLGVEGGLWKEGKFEARIDAIWDGNFEAKNALDIINNNAMAAEFIKTERLNNNAFIITIRSN